MMFIYGFLFILGGMFAIAFFIFGLILFIRSQKKQAKADGKAWREYLNQIVKDNEFAEAAFINRLLEGKTDNEEINTPDGYKVHVDKSLVIDENSSEQGLSKIKVHKTFKISKINPNV